MRTLSSHRALSVAVTGVVAVVLALIVAPSAALAQSVSFRAQGHYYSAKEAYQRGDYSKALEYVERAEEALKGTNRELQYLHVMSAYNAREYRRAQREMARFFAIAEKTLEPVHFDESVERLSENEVKALTMLINKVDEAVVEEAAARARRAAEAEAARARQEARDRAAKNLAGRWVLVTPPPGMVGSRVVTIVEKKNGIIAAESPDTVSGECCSRMHFGGQRASETSQTVQFTGLGFNYAFRNDCKRSTATELNGFILPTHMQMLYDKQEGTLVVKASTQVNNCNGTRPGRSWNYVFRRQ